MNIDSNLNQILLLILLVSYLSTFFLVPLIKFIGKKYDLYDYYETRKIQNKKLVRIGGIAIFLGYLIGLSVIPFSGNLNNISFQGISLFGSTLLITSSLIFLLGLTDDLIQLSPLFRLISQLIISSIVWSQGIRINQIDLSFFSDNSFIVSLSPLISYLVTIVWIAALVNAFNWIDGLDGLASGLVIITSISFFLIEYNNNVASIACILISLLGSALAFIFYNYNPAKILMGDGGSYFYGFNLAIISFISSSDSDVNLKIYVPLLILLVPIADMVYVIMGRCISGKTPFCPDQTHIHHRLLSIGFSQTETVKLIFTLTIIFSSIVLFLEKIVGPIFIFYSIILFFFINIKKRKFLKNLFSK